MESRDASFVIEAGMCWDAGGCHGNGSGVVEVWQLKLGFYYRRLVIDIL